MVIYTAKLFTVTMDANSDDNGESLEQTPVSQCGDYAGSDEHVRIDSSSSERSKKIDFFGCIKIDVLKCCCNLKYLKKKTGRLQTPF